jgi:hypothetical protein
MINVPTPPLSFPEDRETDSDATIVVLSLIVLVAGIYFVKNFIDKSKEDETGK